MTGQIDRAAEALLSIVVVDESGDLFAAFARLCAGTSIGDVEGETYGAALERMLRTHLTSARHPRTGAARDRTGHGS